MRPVTTCKDSLTQPELILNSKAFGHATEAWHGTAGYAVPQFMSAEHRLPPPRALRQIKSALSASLPWPRVQRAVPSSGSEFIKTKQKSCWHTVNNLESTLLQDPSSFAC